MEFRIDVSGTHNEGTEAKQRFDKIVTAAIEKLHSNGFIATYVQSSPDLSSTNWQALPAHPKRHEHQPQPDAEEQAIQNLQNEKVRIAMQFPVGDETVTDAVTPTLPNKTETAAKAKAKAKTR